MWAEVVAGEAVEVGDEGVEFVAEALALGGSGCRDSDRTYAIPIARMLVPTTARQPPLVEAPDVCAPRGVFCCLHVL